MPQTLGEMPDDLATVWQLVRAVGTRLDRAGEALFRSGLDVSLAQYLVLSVVDAHPGNLSQQAVADRVGLTKGSVSRQIDAAVSAGLMTVRVASHSRRENVVALTSKGTALVRKGDALIAASRAGAPELRASDLAATIRVLRALAGWTDPD